MVDFVFYDGKVATATETVFFYCGGNIQPSVREKQVQTTTAATVFLAAQQQRHLILHFYHFLKGTEASV